MHALGDLGKQDLNTTTHGQEHQTQDRQRLQDTDVATQRQDNRQTQDQQQQDRPTQDRGRHTQDRDEYEPDRTERKRSHLGPPTNSAENQEKQRKRNNSKTLGKRKNKSKAKNKEDKDRALDREEMDRTGQDWEDGDGNVLRETTPRTSKRLQAHGSLHST